MSYSDHLVQSGARGEFGSAVPVRPCPGRSTPTHCPRGHRLAVGGATEGWSHFYDLPLHGCNVCQELTPEAASWCQFDPDPARQVLAGSREAEAGGGLCLVVHPPRMRGGVGQIALHLQRHVIGDIDVALCGPCRVGVIEHVRVDPEHRRRGYGRVLVAGALARGSGFQWSTTAVEDTATARAFWAAVADPAVLELGTARSCTDMRIAAGQVE